VRVLVEGAVPSPRTQRYFRKKVMMRAAPRQLGCEMSLLTSQCSMQHGPSILTGQLQCKSESHLYRSTTYHSKEMLEPFARFFRKLPKDANFADESFPRLKTQEILGSFGTDRPLFSA